VPKNHAVSWIYARQLSLGLFWGSLAVTVIWLLSLWNGGWFDFRLAVIAVAWMSAIEWQWSRVHLRKVRGLVAEASPRDFLRSPTKELALPGRSPEWVRTLLLGRAWCDLGIEILEERQGDYQVRRKPIKTRARARVIVRQSDGLVTVQINGRIPWWVGVDEGRACSLVSLLYGYLAEQTTRPGS
jgi:hypothetical protein